MRSREGTGSTGCESSRHGVWEALGALVMPLMLATLAAAQSQGEPGGGSPAAGNGPEQPSSAQAAEPATNPWRSVVFGATFEGYYQYNWNKPPDRVIPLRAYDTRANTFGIQQAAFVVDASPDVDAGRRYGLRADLQWGQATETVQGSAANEPRPDVYRNVWQAYGTYRVPGRRQRAADRLRQVRLDARLRDQLRQGQPSVLARLPVQLPAVLSLGAARDLPGDRQGVRALHADQRHPADRGLQRLQVEPLRGDRQADRRRWPGR